MRHGTIVYLAGAAAGAALIACGGDLNEHSVIDTAAGEIDAPIVATATLQEWSIAIPSDTLRAGPITFRVVNGGTMHHALEVEGQGIEKQSEPLDRGDRDELVVNLRPGTYELYCPLEGPQGNHADLGMRRRIVVR